MTVLAPAQVATFAEQGYLRGPRVLSAREVDELRAELERVLAAAPGSRPRPVLLANLGGDVAAPVYQVVNIWEASRPFQQLIEHPRIAAAVAQLTGARTLRIWHDQVQYKPAAKGGVNMWHQDAPLWPVLAPMTEVSAWVALDDVDEENGCMSMVPGSYRWGDQMAFLAKLPDFDALPASFRGHPVTTRLCPVRKGEVHFHHALTWHGSSANRSGRPRRAVALHFMTEATRYVASGNHVMKRFIRVPDGAVMKGKHFPVVWESPQAE